MLRIRSLLPTAACAFAVCFAQCLCTGAWAASPDSPLAIKDQGGFYVGGETVLIQATRSDGLDLAPGEITVDQTWVQYQIPSTEQSRLPVIMVHGSWHTGKTYLSTPDGREGWSTYFVRNGFPTYIVDNANHSHDVKQHNMVRLGFSDHRTLTPIWRISNAQAWSAFRLGPALGMTYPSSQFPAAAAEQYFAQIVPTPLDPELNQKRIDGLIAVLDKVGPAILLTHSSAGPIGWAAAVERPDLVKGIVAVEPRIGDEFQNFEALANIPILILRGDFDSPSAIGAAESFVERANATGGHSRFTSLPALGIVGNSHLMMMEFNNLEIADVVIDWIDEQFGTSNSVDVTKDVCKDQPRLRCH